MDTENLALRPNCLLTRYPLVFITGTRSLFHYQKLGGFLQDFIAAHGYMVESPPMPFRGPIRTVFLQNWLRQRNSGVFHFIMGEDTYYEFEPIWESYAESTFTLVPRDLNSTLQLKEPLNYKLHRLFCMVMGAPSNPFNQTLSDQSPEFYDRFLDHCVDLAENDAL